MHYIADKVVHRSTRDRLITALPGLAANKGDLTFFNLIWLSSHRNPKTGRLILPARRIAKAYDKRTAWIQNNFESGKVIKRFCDKYGITIVHTQYNSQQGLCREIIKIIWPPVVEAILQDEINGVATGDKVYLVSGKKRSQQSRSQQRGLVKQAVEEEAKPPVNAMQQRWQDYLNALPGNAFVVSDETMDAARAKLNVLKADGTYSTATYEHQERVLRAIEAQPQPFYSPSDKGSTSRLFGEGETLLALKSDLRQILHPDWLEFDIKNCQLAILAREWNLPKLSEVLATGESVWDYIAREMGVVKTPRFKKLVKDSSYAIPFGRTVNWAILSINRELGYGMGEKFIQIPVIQELLAARSVQEAKIEAAGGGFDCFGKWHNLADYRRPGAILAIQAQALEMMLLEPILDLAERSRGGEFGDHGFIVSIYQFDGFSVKVDKNTDKVKWAARLKDAFKVHVDNLGVDTMLEQKPMEEYDPTEQFENKVADIYSLEEEEGTSLLKEEVEVDVPYAMMSTLDSLLQGQNPREVDFSEGFPYEKAEALEPYELGHPTLGERDYYLESDSPYEPLREDDYSLTEWIDLELEQV